jgi:[ribosomal protein S5]-alanine N-acetyltransferase
MIETARLIIIPLTHSQLLQYRMNDGSLDAALNLRPSKRIISDELQEALELTILPNVSAQGKNHLFSTLWTIISKEENIVVGDLCFMGEPNVAGEIEIGYGIYEDFRKRGFMTEAVRGMVKWAEKQPNVKSIIASTFKNNIASYSVLLNNDFLMISETNTLFKWELEIKR